MGKLVVSTGDFRNGAVSANSVQGVRMEVSGWGGEMRTTLEKVRSQDCHWLMGKSWDGKGDCKPVAQVFSD